MRDPFQYTWWLGSRAAGIVGFALLGLVTVLGLVQALKLLPARQTAALRPWHERLALTGLMCIGAHGALLLFDPWLHPGITGVLIPFTMKYRPLWTGLGVIAAYLLAGFGLSFYARRRVGARRWRKAHRLAPIGFGLGAIHALGAGTDASSIVLLGTIALFIGLVAALVAARLAGPRLTAPPKPARSFD